MTPIQRKSKEKKLSKLRKQYKYHVIHDDAATKINHIKELIQQLENQLKSNKIQLPE